MGLTCVATYFVNGTTAATTSLVTASFSPNIGDVYVVKVVGAHTTITIGTPTGGNIGTLGWRRILTDNTNCPAGIWTSTAESTGATTITVPFTGTGNYRMMVVEQWAGGAHLTGVVNPSVTTWTGTTAPSGTQLSHAPESVMTWLCVDANYVAGSSRVYRTTSATPTESAFTRHSADYTVYAAYQDAASPATQTVGLTAPAAGLNYRMYITEIQAQPTTPSGVLPAIVQSKSAVVAAGAANCTVTLDTDPTIGNILLAFVGCGSTTNYLPFNNTSDWWFFYHWSGAAYGSWYGWLKVATAADTTSFPCYPTSGTPAAVAHIIEIEGFYASETATFLSRTNVSSTAGSLTTLGEAQNVATNTTALALALTSRNTTTAATGTNSSWTNGFTALETPNPSGNGSLNVWGAVAYKFLHGDVGTIGTSPTWTPAVSAAINTLVLLESPNIPLAAAPPTVVTYKDARGQTSGATRVLTQRTVATGDVVAVIVIAETQAIAPITIAKSAGTATISTIAMRQDPGATNGAECGLRLFTFTVTSGGTLTLTVTTSSAGGDYIQAQTYVATGSGGVGNTAQTSTSTTTITAALTTSLDSYVIVCAADYNAVGGATTTLTPAGGVLDLHEADGVVDRTTSGGGYAVRGGHWADVAADTVNYGVTLPTSTGYILVACELLGIAVGPLGQDIQPTSLQLTTTVPTLPASAGSRAGPTVIGAAATLPTQTIVTNTLLTKAPFTITATITASTVATSTSQNITASPLATSRTLPPAAVRQDQTTTPTTIPAAATIITPAPSAGAALTQPPTITTISVPAVTVQRDATATPTPIAATRTIPASSITAVTNAAPAATIIASVTVVAQPTVRQDRTITRTVVGSTTTIPQSTVLAVVAGTAAPTPFTTTTTIPASSVQQDQTITATVVAGTRRFSASLGVSAGSQTTPGVLVAAATFGAPTVRRDSTITGAVVAAASTIVQPAVASAIAATATANTVVAAAIIITSTIRQDRTTTPTVLAATATIPTTSIVANYAVSITSTIPTAQTTLPAPTVQQDRTITTAPPTTTTYVPTVSPQQSQNITAAVIAASTATPAAKARQDRNVTAPPISSTITEPAAGISTGQTLSTAPIKPTTAFPAHLVQVDVDITATPQATTSTIPTPDITAVVASNPLPAIIATTAVLAPPTIAVGSTLTPTPAAIIGLFTTPTPAASTQVQRQPINPPTAVLPTRVVFAVLNTTITAAPLAARAVLPVALPHAYTTSTVDVIAATTLTPEPTTSAASTVDAQSIVGTSTFPEQTIRQDANASTSPTTTTATFPAQHVLQDHNLQPAALVATLTTPTAAISVGCNLTTNVLTATLLIPTPDISHPAAISGLTITGSLTFPHITVTTLRTHPLVKNPTQIRLGRQQQMLEMMRSMLRGISDVTTLPGPFATTTHNDVTAVHIPASATYVRLRR